MMADAHALLEPIRNLHARIRDEVVRACERASLEEMARVAKDESGDTIYAVDEISEPLIVEALEKEVACHAPLVLIAEGLPNEGMVLPRGASQADARWRIIIDPIDGTRGLMYQKRSAWILTGVAPNRGPGTTLADIELAVQTEIPLLKQYLMDELWAERGAGASAERINRFTGERRSLRLRPSQAKSIAHGFAMVVRFFPGARDVLAAIDEEIIRGALEPIKPGKAHCFEDQYISTGGQLYELMSGHDRFVADLRPYAERVLARQGLALGLCCHPYDLSTELIAREAGVIVADPAGGPLKAPLDTETDVSWAGYANQTIHDQIAPLLVEGLSRRGLLG
jgi:fructose-1,6-bisphosphatase/inositol monophosphatase family enzyme